jgi:SAM-dependent methyltransferase
MQCGKCGSEVSAAAQVCTWCGFADPGIPTSAFRRRAVSAFDATPGSALIRRIIGKEDVYVVRSRLARQYLRGSGIEFGALNAPLDVPDDINVTYADLPENEAYIALAKQQYGHATAATIFADIETMIGIPNESADFVIANQVLEHVENPLLALRSISRVLRSSGIAFISLPDKRFSFDRRRAITTLDHFIRDYQHGPDASRAEHYDDWVLHAEGLEGPDRTERVTSMLSSRANIHFHVWDFDAMATFFNYAASLSEIGLSVLHSQQNRGEGVWVLQKSAHTSC